jgi:hypothetical protein
MNTGIILSVALMCLGIGFVIGQNTKCINFLGATTCVVNNPLK